MVHGRTNRFISNLVHPAYQLSASLTNASQRSLMGFKRCTADRIHDRIHFVTFTQGVQRWKTKASFGSRISLSQRNREFVKFAKN